MRPGALAVQTAAVDTAGRGPAGSGTLLATGLNRPGTGGQRPRRKGALGPVANVEPQLADSDLRPPVWIGHINLTTDCLADSHAFMAPSGDPSHSASTRSDRTRNGPIRPDGGRPRRHPQPPRQARPLTFRGIQRQYSPLVHRARSQRPHRQVQLLPCVRSTRLVRRAVGYGVPADHQHLGRIDLACQLAAHWVDGARRLECQDILSSVDPS